MRSDNYEQARQYALVARAITFIREHVKLQPSLEQIGAAVHVSPFHLQRLFAEWAGLSPKRFLQYLTKEYAKQQLMMSHDALSVTESAGLSSTSRLHDLMVTCEAMTPGEIKAGADGMEVTFGFAFSPFGEVIVGCTARGICHFAFCIANHDAMKAELVSHWPNARFSRDDLRPQPTNLRWARVTGKIPKLWLCIGLRHLARRQKELDTGHYLTCAGLHQCVRGLDPAHDSAFQDRWVPGVGPVSREFDAGPVSMRTGSFESRRGSKCCTFVGNDAAGLNGGC